MAPGTDSSSLFLGAVFGFLSFAGFEAAATLGEEARRPRRDVPRATAIFGGAYFVFVTAVEVMGFGTDDAGIAAFTKSGSLVGDLGGQYVGAWVGDRDPGVGAGGAGLHGAAQRGGLPDRHQRGLPDRAGGRIVLGVLAVAALPRLARFGQREEIAEPAGDAVR